MGYTTRSRNAVSKRSPWESRRGSNIRSPWHDWLRCCVDGASTYCRPTCSIPTSVGLAAARLAGTPLTILTRHHADFTTLFNKPIHRRIDRWHALFADQIWTPSEFIKDCMVRHEGVPAERITVLPLAFNFDVMKPSLHPEKRRALRDEMGGNDDYIIGMVGRLSPSRKATSTCSARCPSC